MVGGWILRFTVRSISNRLLCCSDFRWAMDTFKDEFYNATISVPKEEV